MQETTNAFTIENGVLVRYLGEEEAATIPGGVTTIDRRAFLGKQALVAVTIPESVTEIENFAFAGCNALTALTLPKALARLGKEAFRGCALTAIHIPAALTEIGEAAFAECAALTTITCDVRNPRYMAQGNCLIEKKTRTLVLGCAESVIPAGVKIIAPHAFRGAKHLTTLRIPASVREIGNAAFANCLWLRSAVIPDTVTRVGAGIFCGTPLSELTIPFVGRSRTEGRLYSNLGYLFLDQHLGDPICANLCIPVWLKRVHVTDAPKLTASAFAGCQHLMRITLSCRTKLIARGAFGKCVSLKELAVPYRLLPTLPRAARIASLVEYLDHLCVPAQYSKVAHKAYRAQIKRDAKALLPRIKDDPMLMHRYETL